MRAVVLVVLLTVASAASAAPTLVARIGDPSPLGPPFSSFSDVAVDDRGDVAFVGASTVLFERTASGIVHVAGAGDRIGDHDIAGVGPIVVGSGCFAFRASFVGGGAGIVRRCGTSTAFVAETGSADPAGGRFVGLAAELAVGRGGAVAFAASLDDGTTALLVDPGDGAVVEIARTGRPSPAGGTFSGLRLIGMAGSGRVGFRAFTSSGPDGLFFWDGAAIQKLAVVGDAADTGGRFTSLGLASMNDAETWTFRASVSSGSRGAIFRASTVPALPAIRTIVAERDGAPGGGTFKTFPSSLVPAINAAGIIAFRATLADAPGSAAVFVVLGDGTIAKAVGVGETTSVGQLVRLRELALADDGGIVLRASLIGGTPGLFRIRGGQVAPLALLGDGTDVGTGFRFSDPGLSTSSDDVFVRGTRDGVFVKPPMEPLRTIALLGDRTPLGGQWAGFDQPAAGGARIVFGATIQNGRAGEAIFEAGRRAPVVVARSGAHVGKSVRLIDIFGSAIDNLSRPAVARGGVAFEAGLGGGTSGGIVLARGGRLRAVALEGGRAPGGGTYTSFGTPALADGARTAFVAVRDEAGALFASAGGKARLLAAAGDETNTRLRGVFRSFDPPAAGPGGFAFHATLDQPTEGVFLARRGCTMAIVGSNETDPSGTRYRSFGPPAFAGSAVVFRGTTTAPGAPIALYRARPPGTCTQVPPPVEMLLSATAPAGLDAPVLGFGALAGTRAGAVAFAVDLTGGGPTDAIVYDAD